MIYLINLYIEVTLILVFLANFLFMTQKGNIDIKYEVKYIAVTNIQYIDKESICVIHVISV